MANSDSYFKCSRVNDTTFVIVESDKYKEWPFIYAKIYNEPPLVVLSDTGCGGSAQVEKSSTDLKSFIETIPVASNGGKPLNPLDNTGKPSRKYFIICTHCHYDHILGLNAFRDTSAAILASSYDRSFVEDNLAEHSLCKSLGVPVPEYTVSHWANDCEEVTFEGQSLRLEILHTPGHTPDELAWYDETERHLYVGDSFYERVAHDKTYEQAILFPKEGSIIQYMQTLYKLLTFVKEKNAENGKAALKIGCGHVTSSVDAKDILWAVHRLFVDIIDGKVPIVHSEEKRGEEFVTWQEKGEPRFSVAAPKRLMTDARGVKYGE